MGRVLGFLASAFVLLAGVRLDGQTSAVSALHTVSIHVGNVDSFNRVYRLLVEEYRLPLIYGKLLTPDLAGRRNYAGIWAGNVRLEICGPYPSEFAPGEPPARLHGLTFEPLDSAEASVALLAQRGVRHRGPLTWGGAHKFVILDEPAAIGPRFSVSIMDVGDRRRNLDENAAVRARLAEDGGGALGLRSVREVTVTYSHDDALRPWRDFLGRLPWPGIRLVKGSQAAIDAVVLDVEAPARVHPLLDRARALGIRLIDQSQL